MFFIHFPNFYVDFPVFHSFGVVEKCLPTSQLWARAGVELLVPLHGAGGKFNGARLVQRDKFECTSKSHSKKY